MARFKKKRAATRRRAAFKKVRRKAKGMLTGQMGQMIAAGGYGAVRARVSNFVAPLAQKLPFAGNIADEVAAMIGLWGAKKLLGSRVPLVTKVANAGMLIEAAQIGQAIGSGNLGIGTGGATGGNAAANDLFSGGDL